MLKLIYGKFKVIYLLLKHTIIKKKFSTFGINSYIYPNSRLFMPQNISIGKNVLIHSNSYLDGLGEIDIEDNFVSAANLTIITGNHNFEECQLLPWDEKYTLKKVHIKKNVWCGFLVTILPGVTIGEGAIIGACSVVTKDVPKCAIVAGNPARILRYRNIKNYDELETLGKYRQMRRPF